MTVYPIKATFSRGELSPRLHGRVDIDHYKMGLETCTNFYVLRQGGLRRRPGTVFVAEIKDSTKKARLIPFEFNETQAYAVELGDLYCRFYALDGQVESGGSPYEITHSYLEADLFDIHYEQSADVIYLAHGDYFPQTLTRSTETSWAMADFEAEDGPYLEENTTSTTLTPSATGAVHPLMTSNVLPSPYVTSIPSGSPTAYSVVAASRNISTNYSGPINRWWQLNLASSRVCDGYWLRSSYLRPGQMYKDWVLQGWDGSSWITLDAVNDEIGWNRSELRFYTFENSVAYSKYRLYIYITVDNNDAIADGHGLHWKMSDQSGITLTASSITGINDDTGFQATDVNRCIRLYGQDGHWRWAKITGVTSTTVVTVQIGDHSLPSTSTIIRWKMSAWNDYDGYPQTVGFFNERLAWAGSASYPRTVWFSESANYNGYRVSSPVVDSDGVSLTMTGGQINKIQWIKDIYDLAAGTTQTVRTIGAATSSSPFSAGNVEQKQQTTEGASHIQPITVGETTIYADYYKKRLREFTYSFELNGYQAPELSVLSDHIYTSGISSLSYQAIPDNLIWIGLASGRMGCTTFEKNQSIVGMTQMFIAGGSADTDGEAIVESHCTVPTESGDRLWMIVKRTINGVTKRYVEYLAEPFEEDDVEDGVFFDSSVTVTGSDFTTVSGLTHLEGETIGVLADGVDIGDATVASAQITLPGGVSADKATVGLRYQSYGKTLRMAEAGNRDGTAMGRRKAINEIYLDAYETGALHVGTSTRQFEMFPRKMSEAFGEPKQLHTGFEKAKTEGQWSGDGQIVFHTNRGYPATIRALVAGIDGEP